MLSNGHRWRPTVRCSSPLPATAVVRRSPMWVSTAATGRVRTAIATTPAAWTSTVATSIRRAAAPATAAVRCAWFATRNNPHCGLDPHPIRRDMCVKVCALLPLPRIDFMCWQRRGGWQLRSCKFAICKQRGGNFQFPHKCRDATMWRVYVFLPARGAYPTLVMHSTLAGLCLLSAGVSSHFTPA